MKLGKLHVIKPLTNNAYSASVIFLHGSGDTGKGFLDWIKFLIGDFSSPYIKFLFPTAPLQPYTPLEGELSNVWFDRKSISPNVEEDENSLESIKAEILLLIKNEIDSGIPLNRIIIGGFSMGGALALHTAYRFSPGLKGVFTLSSFLNNNSLIYRKFQACDTPLLMYHGDRDTMVELDWGKNTFDKLTSLGVKGEFKIIKNTLHELKKNVIEDVMMWCKKLLPEQKS